MIDTEQLREDYNAFLEGLLKERDDAWAQVKKLRAEVDSFSAHVEGERSEYVLGTANQYLREENAKLRAEVETLQSEAKLDGLNVKRLRARLALAEAVARLAPRTLDAMRSADHYTGRGVDEADEMETKFREALEKWGEGKG